MTEAIFLEKEPEALLPGEARLVMEGSCPGHPDQELLLWEKRKWEADRMGDSGRSEEDAPGALDLTGDPE